MTFRKIRAERKLFKNLRFHLSEAMAFVDSCAEAPIAAQQAAAQRAGNFPSERQENSKDEMIRGVVEAIAFEYGVDVNELQDSTFWADTTP